MSDTFLKEIIQDVWIKLVDKMYADKDKKEHTLAIQELGRSIKQMNDNLVRINTENILQAHRLTEVEKCCAK